MDISAGPVKELESVSLALGKAFTGNVAALIKLGIPLDETTKKTKDLQKIQEVLQAQFGGAAATAADTFSGRLQILKTSLGEIVESIGYLLMPYFEKFVAFIQEYVVPAVAAFVGALQDEQGLRGALLAAANSAGEFGIKVLDVIETVAIGFLSLLKTLAKFGAGIAAIAAIGTALTGNLPAAAASIAAFTGLYYAYDRMDGVIETTRSSFDGFRSDLSAMPKNAKEGSLGLTNLNIKLIETGAVATASQQVLRDTLDLIRRFNAQGPVLPFIGPLAPAQVKALYNETNAGIDKAKALADKYKDLFSNIGGGAKDTKDKIKTLAEQTTAYEKALGDLNTTQNRARDSMKSVEAAAKTLTKAKEKVTTAQDKFNLVTHGYSKASKEYISALNNVQDATRSVRDASLQQSDAIKAVTDAESALAKLRNIKSDPNDVAEAERNLERSKYDIEQANFAVIEAEAKLAELRADPATNPIELRKQEIELAEAKLAVADSINDAKQSEKSLEEFRQLAAKPEEIAKAERDLADAKRDVEDATDNLADSIYNHSIAQLEYIEIAEGAKESSETYKEALLDLQEAQDAETEAAERHTKSLEDQTTAVNDLKNAIADLNGVTGKITKPKAVTNAESRVGKTTQELLDAANGILTKQLPKATTGLSEGARDAHRFADGGIVTRPTLGLVGEAGAEAIIPLSKFGGMGGDTYITVNAGMGTDGADIGQQIIDAIKKAERRSGRVFAAA